MRRNETRRDEIDLTGNRVEKSVITDTNHDGTFSAATDRDSVTQYTQDANDRMLSESTVVDGSATESTVYGYTGTQQTSKTITDNTTSSVTSAVNYTYDLQGRMSRAVTVAGNRTSDVSYLYGTDGIRISAREDVTENGSTSTRITSYLIDAQNHTGYQQVLQETVTDGTGNLIQKIVYTIGHDHISQSTWRAGDVSPPSVAVFHFDGHGNTRILTDLAGSIVTLAGLLQVYHYDAYGNALNFTMSAAATQYLYSGEQFDPRIGQQYLRARYYDSATGTFNRLDPFFGNQTDPQSFHKYRYTNGDPVLMADPTGMYEGLAGMLTAMNLGVAGAVIGGGIGGYIGHRETGELLSFTTLKYVLVGALTGFAIGATIGALLPNLLPAAHPARSFLIGKNYLGPLSNWTKVVDKLPAQFARIARFELPASGNGYYLTAASFAIGAITGAATAYYAPNKITDPLDEAALSVLGLEASVPAVIVGVHRLFLGQSTFRLSLGALAGPFHLATSFTAGFNLGYFSTKGLLQFQDWLTEEP